MTKKICFVAPSERDVLRALFIAAKTRNPRNPIAARVPSRQIEIYKCAPGYKRLRLESFVSRRLADVHTHSLHGGSHVYSIRNLGIAAIESDRRLDDYPRQISGDGLRGAWVSFIVSKKVQHDRNGKLIGFHIVRGMRRWRPSDEVVRQRGIARYLKELESRKDHA